MASILPPIPKLTFTILEPISLLMRPVSERFAGAVASFADTSGFVSSQLSHLEPHSLLPTERLISLQLGNLYMLLGLLGLFILNTTQEPCVVHMYILALWIADIGHVGVTAWVMGFNAFVDIANWNAMTYGSVGATTLLFCVRTLYLLGLLGDDRASALKKMKKIS